MATAAELQVRDRIFIGGEWVAPIGQRADRGGQLDHRGGDGHGPRLLPGGRRPRRRRRPRGLRLLVADFARGARRLHGGDRRRARRAQRGDRGDDLPGAGDAAEAEPDDPGRPADRPVRGDAEADGGNRLGGGDRQLAGAARAGRRARRDHPLELPAEPDRLQGRPRPRRRLHRRPQAERGDAAQRLPAGRGDRGRRPPGRRLQPRHRHRAGRRRGDRRPPRRRHGLLHRLDPGRQAGQRAGLGDGQAGGDGARRQVAERDPRRRRPRQGGPRRRRQVLPQLRPDLQRPDPDAGPARQARRGRADRRRDRRGLHPRRPVRRLDPARPARLRRPAPARARLHREGRGRGREAGDRRRRGAGGPRPRLLRPPHRLLRGDAGDDDRPGGDLRPGAGDPALRRRGGRGADRQRQRLRPRRRRLVGRPGAGDRGRQADPHRPDRDQRRRLQPAGPVRRLRPVRPRPRERPLWRSSRSCCRSRESSGGASSARSQPSRE